MLLHLAAVQIEEVLSCLNSSESFLGWMTKVEEALFIIKETRLTILKKLAISKITLFADNLLSGQSLKLMWLTTLDLLELELQALHTSDPVLALIRCLPSAKQALMLQLHITPLADCAFQLRAGPLQELRRRCILRSSTLLLSLLLLALTLRLHRLCRRNLLPRDSRGSQQSGDDFQ
jgi:hypothetical protein